MLYVYNVNIILFVYKTLNMPKYFVYNAINKRNSIKYYLTTESTP